MVNSKTFKRGRGWETQEVLDATTLITNHAKEFEGPQRTKSG